MFDMYSFFRLCSSLQVGKPPIAGAFLERKAKPTSFRKFYERGDFPIALEHDTKGNRIAWKVSIGILINLVHLHFLFCRLERSVLENYFCENNLKNNF